MGLKPRARTASNTGRAKPTVARSRTVNRAAKSRSAEKSRPTSPAWSPARPTTSGLWRRTHTEQTDSADQTFGSTPPVGCPNDAVRQQTGAAYLPDCRGYELVNPPQLGGAALVPVGPASPSGQGRLSFTALLSAIPGAGEPLNGSLSGDFYVASRTVSGWKTKYVGIPGYESISQGGAPDNSFSISGPEPAELGSEGASSILTDTEHEPFRGLGHQRRGRHPRRQRTGGLLRSLCITTTKVSS